MISFRMTISVLCLFLTFSWEHITLVDPNLKLMTLTPSTDHLIHNVTHNLSLECAFNYRVKPWQTSMTQILRIRIFKSDINDEWDLMAEIRQDEDSIPLYDNVLGRGQVKGDMWTSYLNITWPIVTAATFGKYQCDVLGYDTHLNYISEKSNSVLLSDCHVKTEKAFKRFQHALDREVEVIDEKFNLMDKSITYDKQNMEKKVNDLSNTLMAFNQSLRQNLQSSDEKLSSLISTLNISLENCVQSMDETFSSLKSTDDKFKSQISTLKQLFENTVQSMDEKLSSLNSTVTESLEHKAQSMDKKINFVKEQLSTLNKTVQYSTPYQTWPEGTYSLLEPLTGCPHHDDWKKGYHKLHTESIYTKNRDELSSPSHLPPYTMNSERNKNYVTLYFCTKVTSTPGISWPTGSYCINNRGGDGSCPPGFDIGIIHMELEYTDNNNGHGGYTPHHNPSTTDWRFYFLYYCCRSDGPATTPIDLPTADPFYLYRFNGTCQSVTNMQVSNEYIIIDTEDTTNADRYQNDNHPDGSLNPVRIELCYYTPK